MVRVNLLEPSALSDQHLIAEYSEILRLLGYVRKHPEVNSRDAHFLRNPVRYFSDKLPHPPRKHFYKYYRKNVSTRFLVGLIRKGKTME
jgi:hypothetical protein